VYDVPTGGVKAPWSEMRIIAVVNEVSNNGQGLM